MALLCEPTEAPKRFKAMQCNETYGNPSLAKLALFYDISLLSGVRSALILPDASRDKPENQRDRLDRKIPHARPDHGVSSPAPSCSH